jgi:hypothetical protein
MRLWDKLLPQTVLTLNLLRQSNAAPTVSAYQYVGGSFNYRLGVAQKNSEMCSPMSKKH